ncbi:NF038120 family PEP-CTERM protein [Massilia sp. W12]|uniref:NF038120 family PEP-CTERM protein n=1 Tax=Massilia sp. W12 TaxID=3126507 RepID=UPI0030CD3B53
MKRSNFLRSAKFAASALAVFATFAANSAQAEVLDFNNLFTGDFSIFAHGESFAEQGFNFTVLGDANGGLAGAGVSGANDLSCTILSCPTGNSSAYYAGLNDGALSFTRQDSQGFKLRALDFAFVAPTGGLIDFSVGRLVLTGQKMDGSEIQTTVEFQPMNNDSFNFSNWQSNGAFAQTAFRGLTINACLYTMDGSCVNPAGNQAQFAIDNLNVAVVPEPSTYAMMGLGLAGLAAFARRRKQA